MGTVNNMNVRRNFVVLRLIDGRVVFKSWWDSFCFQGFFLDFQENCSSKHSKSSLSSSLSPLLLALGHTWGRSRVELSEVNWMKCDVCSQNIYHTSPSLCQIHLSLPLLGALTQSPSRFWSTSTPKRCDCHQARMHTDTHTQSRTSCRVNRPINAEWQLCIEPCTSPFHLWKQSFMSSVMKLDGIFHGPGH